MSMTALNFISVVVDDDGDDDVVDGLLKSSINKTCICCTDFKTIAIVEYITSSIYLCKAYICGHVVTVLL